MHLVMNLFAHSQYYINKNIQATISVGNLGTNPILKYSITTGIPNISDIS